VNWETRWESDLSPEEHRAIADLLRDSLGGVRAEDAEHFQGARSWAGARPEFRLVLRDDCGVLAHIGVLRRHLRIGERDQLVGDLGLFAIRPDRQRTGLGSALLTELRGVLFRLDLPFGFLGCRPELVPFYERNDWHLLPSDVRVRYIDNRDPWTIVTLQEPAFVQPLRSPLAAWPKGDLIDRNGLEV
jgi:nodulation protein A